MMVPLQDPLRVAVRRAARERRAFSRACYAAARVALLGGSVGIGALVLSGAARTQVGQAAAWVVVIAFYSAPLMVLVGWVATLMTGAVKDTTVLVDREGVTVEPTRRVLVGREAVAFGIVVPRGPVWDVELEARSGDVVHLGVADEATADGVLAALALDAAQRRTTVRFGRFFHRFLLGWATLAACSGAAMAIGQALEASVHVKDAHIAATLLGTPLGLLLIGPVNRRLVWKEISVGLDGLSVRSGLSRRFLPFADVVRAEIYQERRYARGGGSFLAPAGIELWRGDGGSERVALDPDDAQIRDALLLRVQQALSAGRRPEEPASTLALLARGERPLAEWRRELAQVWGDGAYRERALLRDDVTSALTDQAAAREHRIGAALALMAAGDPEATAQVRSAADTCADPSLREALGGIASGDASDEAIAEALRT